MSLTEFIPMFFIGCVVGGVMFLIVVIFIARKALANRIKNIWISHFRSELDEEFKYVNKTECYEDQHYESEEDIRARKDRELSKEIRLALGDSTFKYFQSQKVDGQFHWDPKIHGYYDEDGNHIPYEMVK